MAIQHQIHESFKVFAGSSLEDVSSQIKAFTSSGSIAAKSIGVEYLDGPHQLVVSLGYTENQPGYPVSLFSKPVGKLDLSSAESRSALENHLSEAAEAAGNVVCHEMFVTAGGDVTAVFMVHG
jgi:hypothetical protein